MGDEESSRMARYEEMRKANTINSSIANNPNQGWRMLWRNGSGITASNASPKMVNSTNSMNSAITDSTDENGWNKMKKWVMGNNVFGEKVSYNETTATTKMNTDRKATV